MIESFKFLAYHIRTCGEEHIRVISEEVDEYIDQLHDEYNAFLEQTKHIFPHSKDWEFLDRVEDAEGRRIERKMGGGAQDRPPG
ncbi:hypothetical protein [Brevibacillus gelatini]